MITAPHPKIHSLASHSTKAHSELTGVTSSQHHAKTVSSDIDHGGIQGLVDDDHNQYYNQARGDNRYQKLGISNEVKLIGYDYTNSLYKFLAVDPDTKALLFAGEGGGGVTDHGALTGLDDDDHICYVDKGGGIMTGPLTLWGAPTSNLHAATKKYVDDNIPGTKARCFVRLTHDQVISTDPGKAVIELDAKDVDVGSNFNTTTHRFTAPESAYYSMAAQLWLDGQATNKIWKAFFQINGIYNNANVMKGIGHVPPTGDGTDDSPRVFWPVKWLNEGNYVEFWGAHHAGINQTVQGIEPYAGHKTWMSIIQL